MIKIISIIFLYFTSAICFSQDTLDITKHKWKKLYDKYSLQVLLLMAKRDTLNREIDSLRKLNSEIDEIIDNFDSIILRMVGKDENSIKEFRIKFDETERKINESNFTPNDIHTFYFDEISKDPAICLEEFNLRFWIMKKKLKDLDNHKMPDISNMKTYIVKKDDSLWKIAAKLYNNPDLWVIIWEANKNDALNINPKFISNPNLIYPGQILTIPALNK